MTIPDYSLVFYPAPLLAMLLAGISKGGFGAAAGRLAMPDPKGVRPREFPSYLSEKKMKRTNDADRLRKLLARFRLE